MFLGDDNPVVANAFTGGRGEVGRESKGRDESCQDMEQAFLLDMVSYWFDA